MKQYGKRILWTICIVVICVADQQIGSAMGERQLIFRNVPVIVLGLTGLSHYPLKSYLKPLYYVWAVISAVVSAAVILRYGSQTYYPGRLCWNVILGVIYSLLLLRTLYALFREKIRPTVNKRYLLLFGAFLGMVLLSRYDDYQTMIYLVCFGILYLTAFSLQEKKELESAVIDGIIIGFFIIQGLAFVHRPYDTLRYLGMYSNTNINALMYQTAYCAFLGRFCLLESEVSGGDVASALRLRRVWKWLCFVLAAGMWGFVFLTMCRSAMISMAVVTVIVWIRRLMQRKGKRLLAFAGNTALYMTLIILGFPVVYGAVRYLPPVFHRPLYFYEGYSEDRVQSYDPWDSPKYTSWSDVVEQNLGRLADLIPWLGEGGSETEKEWEVARYTDGTPVLCADNRQASLAVAGALLSSEELTKQLSEEEEELLSEKSTHVRVNIYSHYISRLNLWGHKEAENGLQVDDNYYAPHAHNVFLQCAFNYGIIACILFVLMVFTTLKALWSDRLPLFVLYLSLFVFGMTEIMWRNGTLPYCLVYLIPLLIQQPDGQEGEVARKAGI